MMYEVYRHTICGDREIEDLDYFDNRKEAEKVAAELTETYKEDDGHPWSGDKFLVMEISEQTIEDRQYSWALKKAYAEMYL